MLIRNLFVIASCLLSLPAFAKDQIIITSEAFIGESADEANSLGGLGGEIVVKALTAAKIEYKVDWKPWNRAQAIAQENKSKNIFIIPLTRNVVRENSYFWVNKLYHADTSCISAKGKAVIDSFENLNGNKVGTLRTASTF